MLMIVAHLSLTWAFLGVAGIFFFRPNSVVEEQRIVVLYMWFDDAPPSTPIGVLQDRMDQVPDYFTECSYSMVAITSSVIGWAELSKPIISYVSSFSVGDIEHDFATDAFILEAIACTDHLVNFSLYNRLVVVHSGHGRQESGNESLIGTCHKTGWFPTSDGRVFLGAAVVSEYDGLGTIAHELGYDFGAPDLYDYHSERPSLTGIPTWGLMSSGNDQGVHMCSYCKHRIEWIQDHDIFQLGNGSHRVDLVPISRQVKGYRAIRYNLPDGRYFLVEARSNAGFDTGLPDNGVIVMLVNESRLLERRDAVQLQIPTQSQRGNSFGNQNNDLLPSAGTTESLVVSDI